MHLVLDEELSLMPHLSDYGSLVVRNNAWLLLAIEGQRTLIGLRWQFAGCRVNDRRIYVPIHWHCSPDSDRIFVAMCPANRAGGEACATEGWICRTRHHA